MCLTSYRKLQWRETTARSEPLGSVQPVYSGRQLSPYNEWLILATILVEVTSAFHHACVAISHERCQSSADIAVFLSNHNKPTNPHDMKTLHRAYPADIGLHYDNRFNQLEQSITTPPEPTIKVKA